MTYSGYTFTIGKQFFKKPDFVDFNFCANEDIHKILLTSFLQKNILFLVRTQNRLCQTFDRGRRDSSLIRWPRFKTKSVGNELAGGTS